MTELKKVIVVDVPKINTPDQLAGFAQKYGLRPDWHEPDEQDIGARVYGTQLDNAMGAGYVAGDGIDTGELNVVLYRIPDSHDEPTEDLAVVNLANLLSWATQHGKL